MLTPGYELNQLKAGITVVGIDEVGRGSWAGPLVMGAYAIRTLDYSISTSVKDSKLLPQKQRNRIAEEIGQKHRQQISLVEVAEISPEVISKSGLSAALYMAIQSLVDEVCAKLPVADHPHLEFLLDGKFIIKKVEAITARHERVSSIKSLPKADFNYYGVAMAAIFAKVFRDNLMRTWALKYPGYGFETNVGYPSKAHIAALKTLGPSPIHRFSFKPLQQMSFSI